MTEKEELIQIYVRQYEKAGQRRRGAMVKPKGAAERTVSLTKVLKRTKNSRVTKNALENYHRQINNLYHCAVRYGIRRKTGGGTVFISTREEKNNIVITVSDTGVGFDVKQKEMAGDDKTHIGMMNVRERLVRQCSGTMEVNSVPGEGTVVNIYIPKT